ncbi:MAG: LegC family aminotransferase [Elusimicrobia bacterium]|nr:LegC family aminotransferase [Elusimicrobiota bacterium]
MTTTNKKLSLALHEPRIAGNEWQYVKQCLDTAWVSSVGAFVDRFEAELARRSGTKHAVAVVNGTSALDLSLRVLGVAAGDEVLVPSLTFIATVNAVAYQGATPVFVDAEESTFGMDPGVLEAFFGRETEMRGGACVRKASGRRIAACVPVHALGYPVRIEPLLDSCRRRSVPVLEDAAEALGSTYRGRPLGSFGRLGALSFNGNKILTTGGGGAIVTDDAELAKRARHLSTQAKSDGDAFWHDAVGFNHRLTNVAAAIGCAQLEQLDGFMKRKREVAELYRKLLAGSPLRLAWEPEGARSNCWLNTLIAPTPEDGARVLAALRARGVGARPLWAPAHRQPMYAQSPRAGGLEVTDRLWRCCVSLPSSVSLTDEDVSAVVEIALGG